MNYVQMYVVDRSAGQYYRLFELSVCSCSNDNLLEQMCKNLSPTKTRRGNCLVLPHTGYALDLQYSNVCRPMCATVSLNF